jgi:hypothetical protein
MLLLEQHRLRLPQPTITANKAAHAAVRARRLIFTVGLHVGQVSGREPTAPTAR